MQNATIQKHTTIKTPDSKHPFALHISKDRNLKVMSPVIGFRQSPDEDRTVPRICVCDTIQDCITGYSAIEYDFEDNGPIPKYNSTSIHGVTFRGGWYIYRLDYEHALIPDTKLVYDAKSSGEYWLINYKKENINYYPKKIGKFFMESSTRRYKDQYGVENTYVFYYRVDEDVWFNDSQLFSIDNGGCYKVINTRYIILDTSGKDHKPDKNPVIPPKAKIEITPISVSQFESARKLSASMLDYTNNFSSW